MTNACDPLVDEQLIENVAHTIVEKFNPQRIVLFGSRARGDAGPESDVDLFVEIETRDRRATAMQIHRLFGPRNWPMDVIVYTPEDVAQWTGQVGTILYDIEREGRVLYDHRKAIPMSPGNPPHPPYRAWLDKAESDLLVVQMCLTAPHIPWDAVCFHSQQSAEKVLKGFLVYHGQQPRKTHKLEDVLVECLSFTPSLKKLHAACVRLSPYGVDPRYPGLGPGLGAREGRAAVRAMERIRAVVLPLIPE